MRLAGTEQTHMSHTLFRLVVESVWCVGESGTGPNITDNLFLKNRDLLSVDKEPVNCGILSLNTLSIT